MYLIACSFLHSWITRMLLAHSSTICIINCILRKLSDFFLSAIISITSSICRCTIRKMQLLLLDKLMCRTNILNTYIFVTLIREMLLCYPLEKNGIKIRSQQIIESSRTTIFSLNETLLSIYGNQTFFR